MFEADKITFSNFVRPMQRQSHPRNHLVFGGKTVVPKCSVKILDTTFDCQLN